MIKVIISGGGTGGHIFPALAIANALKQKYTQVDILFVGAEGKMEMEKVPAAGYKIIGLPVSGLKRSLSLSNLAFPFRLWKSIQKSKKILKDFKPDVAVGVGGFASGPLLYAASLKGVPCLIQEQNSYPGITNKLLAKRAESICVAYEKMDKYFPAEKIKITGNPVRAEVVNLSGKKERGLETFGLDAKRKTIFVTGGSLGARSINESIYNNLAKIAECGYQLIWQTGKLFYEKAAEAVKKYEGKGISAHAFINQMDYCYAVADIVVSRAGAGAVSELCLVKKAAILLPYPFAAEDHQTKNAEALVNRKAGILIKDDEAPYKLWSTITELLEDDERRHKMEENIASLGIGNSAEIIAAEVYSLATKNSVK